MIALDSAMNGKIADENILARTSDLLRAGIGGTPISIGLYSMGVPVLPATAIGAVGGTATGMGAIGQAFTKGMEVADGLAPVAKGLSTSTVRTAASVTPEQNAEWNAEATAPENPAFDQMLDQMGIGTGIKGQQPQGQSFDQMLDNLGVGTGLNKAPETPTPSSAPSVGPLPGQQAAAAQGVGLSGTPDINAYYAALAKHESNFNPMAKNQNSSAKGLFQFVDDTARRTGLENAYDINQQLKAAKQLTEGHRQAFGDDPDLLYAAHYLGQPTLQAVLTGQPLDEQQQVNVNGFFNPPAANKPSILQQWQQNYQAAAQPQSDIMAQFNSLFNRG